MKTPSQTAAEMRNLVDLLMDSGIAIAANPVVRDKHGEFERISWCSTKAVPSGISEGEFATIEEYCSYLHYLSYTAVLPDAGIIQISYDFLKNEMCGHRLCYYPCPFEIDPLLLMTEPILDTVRLHEAAGVDRLRLRSPLRFDYDPDRAEVGHSATHLHFGIPSCRCSVVAPLSIGHFVRFVFRHFYPLLWSECRFLREWPQHLSDRTIEPDDEDILHVACRRN